MKTPLLLRVFKNGALEGVRQFDTSQVIIGRNADAQVALNDAQVSPLHAMIEEREGTYFLTDLGSTAGTILNGKKVLEEKVQSGDEIVLGGYTIQFFIGAPKPMAPPKAATPPLEEKKPTPAPTSVVAPPVEEKKSAPAPVISKPVVTVASTASNVGAKAAPLKSSKGKTYAPASPYNDLKDVLKPGKGSAVEVIVAWKDRVLSSHHFKGRHQVTIGGGEKATVHVPLLSGSTTYQLVRTGVPTTIFISGDMTGELIRDGVSTSVQDLAKQNKVRASGGGYEMDLNPGEMARIGLQNDLVSVYVRFAPDTPKPLVAPLFDLTASEVTGVLLAIVVAAIFSLYMTVYAPTQLTEEERAEEPIRKATVVFQAQPKKKQIVEVVDKPAETKKNNPQPQKQTQTPAHATKSGETGKAGEVAPKKTEDKQKKLTSSRPGGAIKTAPKEGANVKSEKPDPTKVGLLGVFGSKGTQSQLDKAYSGSGELQGMADAATGYAGQAETRPGDSIGTKLKDTGAGGKGTSTIGIAGVGTKGRGTGTYGYGTGGIGKKGDVEINVGGEEATASGGIDREAIRRVIRENIRAIRTCYERELQRKPDLYGKIVLGWHIEEKGRVTKTWTVSNTMGSDEVAQCILARLKTWTFPEPPGDQVASVTYPFVFSSQ